MKKTAYLAFLLPLCLLMGACNAQSTAIKAQGVINAVLTVAAAEEPAIPAQDQAVYTNFVNLGKTLDGQLLSCVTNVSGVMGKSAKFGACFSAFASGLTSPAELSQLRLLSPTAQSKVQLYVTAAVTAVNLIVAFTAPPVAAAPASASDLHNLGIQAGLSSREMAQAGF